VKHEDQELYKVLEQWAHHFGYYDGKIDLSVGGDLTSFVTPDGGLVAHAPLWGVKPGQERKMPAQEVRQNLARMLRFVRGKRHNTHIAWHPDGKSLCLFFVAKIQPKILPITVYSVSLAFIVTGTQTSEGMRISQIDEWSAETPEAARDVLIEKCEWPTSTVFEPFLAFGAAS